MAAVSKVYGPAFTSLCTGLINFTGGTVKAMLCTSAYVPNQDTHQFKSSVTNEVTGTGYTAGGVTLASKTLTYDAPSHTLTLDCADLSWPSSSITARILVVYLSTGTDSTSPLICWVDFGSDQTSVSGTWPYVVPTTGLAQLTAA